MPPKNRIIHIVDAHPAMVLFRTASTIAQTIPHKPRILATIPIPTIQDIGLIDRLVIPSAAKASIFLSG